MSNHRPTRQSEQISRILVGVDSSETSLVSLTLAVDLAANLHAEVHAVFVEDINLIHLAGLPFAREFSLTVHVERPLSDERMATRLRLQAQQARSAVMRAAEDRGVTISFDVARGEVARCLLEAAQARDLIVVGLGGGKTVAPRVGSSARSIASQAPCHVMVVGGRADAQAPVVCVYDGSDTARLALDLAMRLATLDSKLLRVVIAAPEAQQRAALERQSRTQLYGSGLEVSYAHVASATPDAIAATPGRLLVLPASVGVGSEEDLARWLQRIPWPVLLTRPARAG